MKFALVVSGVTMWFGAFVFGVWADEPWEAIKRNGVVYWVFKEDKGKRVEGCEGFFPGTVKVVDGKGIPCAGVCRWGGGGPMRVTERFANAA